jgi:PAS domain S-box-containing protein
MQSLARLRARAARLRGRPPGDVADALEVLDEALELTDAIRDDCSRLQQRCGALEQRIRDQEEASSALLERLPLAVIATDASGTIVGANRAAAKLLGRSAAHLRDSLLLHFFEDRPAFSALLQRLPAEREGIELPFRFRPRERAAFDVLVTVIEDPRVNEPRWVWCIERAPLR